MRFRSMIPCMSVAMAVAAMSVVLSGARADLSARGGRAQGERAVCEAGIDRHEARVNTFTQSTQEHAAVDVYPDGGMVIAWDSRRQEAGTYGVYLQRFAADGSRIGGEIGVNAYRRNMQTSPAVAVDDMGGTWVSWESFGQDGSMGAIVAARFDAGFAGSTGEVMVNETRLGHQFGPVIAADGRGGAMIAWSTPVADGIGRRIVARMFDQWGEPMTAEFAVSPEGGCAASAPSIAVDGCDRFIVAWSQGTQAASPERVFGRMFDDAGAALGEAFPISADDGAAHIEPSVAASRSGEFVVAWMTADPDDYAVSARAFDASGNPATGTIRVSSSTQRHCSGAAVAMRESGKFVVGFNAQGAPGGELEVLARSYSPEGMPLGASRRITVATGGDQSLTIAGGARRVAYAADGRAVFAWSGDTGGGDRFGVGVTVLAPAGIALALRSPDPDAPAANQPPNMIAEPHVPPTYDAATIADDPFGGDLDPTSSGVDDGFIGITNSGWTPPDPHLAVGRDHLVLMTNGAIAFYQKDGTKDFEDEIEGASGFWGAQGTGGFVFDPETLYDPHTGRFMAMACERTGGRGYFLLAVSDDADPNGGWHKYRFDVTGPAGAGNIDSPNMAVDAQAVYLTADFFGPNKYLIFMIDKADVVNGRNPHTTSLLITGQQSMGLPLTYDTDAPQYIIESFEQSSNDQVRFHALLDPLGSPQRVTTRVDVPTYTYPARPPSRGTSQRVTLFEPRFWSAVERNGSVWAVHHVNNSRARVRWYEFKMNGWPDGGTPEVAQWGEIDPGDPVSTFFPSIWVDDAGNAAIVCARSSPDEFFSMSRAIRLAGDPPGTFRPIEFVKQSNSAYTGSRWGDYSGVASDPARPGTFWGHHEYTPGGNSWNTWIAEIVAVEGTTAPPTSFEVTRGVLVGGDLAALLSSDDQYVQIIARRPTEIAVNSVEIEIETTLSNESPASLSFIIEAATTGDPTRQRIDLFNFDTDQWDRLDERTGPSSDTIVRVSAPGDPAAYIEDGTGTVRARVGYLDLGVNFVAWGGRFDHAYWLVVE